MNDIAIYKTCPTCPKLGMCSAIKDIPLRKVLCTGKREVLDRDGQEHVVVKNYTDKKYRNFRKRKITKSKSKRPSKIELFYNVKVNTGKNAEKMLKSVYRKKKSAICKCK